MAAIPNLPYVVSPGRIAPLLEKMQQEQTPPRFTQDFLETKLGMKGGSAAPLIPLLKRIGFLANDGSPTELYRKYRNPDTSEAALAEGIRVGYSELFSRNEYAHELSRDKLTNLIVEITGKEKDDRVVAAIVGTFWTLKERANFDRPAEEVQDQKIDEPKPASNERPPQIIPFPPPGVEQTGLGLNLSYTRSI